MKELKLKCNLKDSDQVHDKGKSINNVTGLEFICYLDSKQKNDRTQMIK